MLENKRVHYCSSSELFTPTGAAAGTIPNAQRLLYNGSIRLLSSHGHLDVSHKACDCVDGEYLFENDYVKIRISIFNKGSDVAYRSMELQSKTDLTLYRVEFITEFELPPIDFVMYKSFISAPSAAFIRYRDYGYFSGVENPFFTVEEHGREIRISYEPSLMLKKGEIYESEPQFLGQYICSGKTICEKTPRNLEAIKKGINRSRFFNPCGEIALDIAESEAMRRYVSEYFDVIDTQFDNILYFFFYPKKQLPKTDLEIEDYLSTIDRFAEIHGDIVVFNPHVNTAIPTNEKPYWELAPHNSPAEKILQHAQDKGLRCGYYMGCAFNGEGGNAALLPFMPEEKEWKKKDVFGNIASENCLGCDDYLRWWYTVQKNTIDKYALGYWAWDPGPGNGNDCYAENHGHIPGKGEYKGWRNSMKLLKWLKSDFPKLFLMSFYGRKEYGIWGFRYFSQHEVYWEQTLLFGATLHNDLSDDRMNAHGTRLQNQWSMNFRFLPAELGHGLVTRMGESWFDPAMDKAPDLVGWKYSLLSAISCCGSVTHCSLPSHLENVPGYTAFYQKWIEWAKTNFHYCKYTRPIADTVSNGIIDGFSRIHGNKGQIFLFNSSPKILRKKLALDESIGIESSSGFYLKFLYCEGFDVDSKDLQYRAQYSINDVLDITIPPYGAVVLELTDTPNESIEDIPRKTHTIDRFTDEEGRVFPMPKHKAVPEIKLTSEVFFSNQLRTELEHSHTENEAFLMEKVSQWHSAGMPFTFISAFPHRLVMYLAFDGSKQPTDVRLYINKREVPIETFCLEGIPISRYAFVEQYVEWGQKNLVELWVKELAENSFMGIYVDYPNLCDGMKAEETIFDEYSTLPETHPDSSLIIDDFTICPEILSDINSNFTVIVKTRVDPQIIENVYILHPTQAMMPALTYDPENSRWYGNYSTGIRKLNIFCNPRIIAWIKSKDGGIGPRAQCKIQQKYLNHVESD